MTVYRLFIEQAKCCCSGVGKQHIYETSLLPGITKQMYCYQMWYHGLLWSSYHASNYVKTITNLYSSCHTLQLSFLLCFLAKQPLKIVQCTVACNESVISVYGCSFVADSTSW